MNYNPDPAQDLKVLHSVEGACTALSLRKSSIYNLVRDGRLQMVKFGSRSLIPDESLKAFVASLPAVETKARAA